MKKYTCPKIRMIELDPKQAILEVCRLGGAYFSGPSSPWIYCMNTTIITNTQSPNFGTDCKSLIKGVANNTPLNNAGADTKPS